MNRIPGQVEADWQQISHVKAGGSSEVAIGWRRADIFENILSGGNRKA